MRSHESLLVDIGNTNLKWALSSAAGDTDVTLFDYRQGNLNDLLDLHWGGLKRPERVLIANVGNPERSQQLDAWITQRWSLLPQFLRSQAAALGVTNAYPSPETLGIDRWLGLIAVHRQIGLPAVIADCGTAVTLDLLTASGRHLGGYILPGLKMMHHALFADTNVPRQPVPPPQNSPAQNTAAAIASGCGRAVALLIERALDEFPGQDNSIPVIVLTGSDAGSVRPLLHRPHRMEPDLIMQGLREIAAQESAT